MMGLLAAFQFLTAIPVPFGSRLSPRAQSWAPAWFPLVGLALGGGLVGLDSLLARVLPSSPRTALLLLALAVATGFLHIDGLMDACDGAFAFGSKAHRLDIMRDPHVGAFGVGGGVLVLLAKYSVLASVPEPWRVQAIALAPSMARWSAVLALAAWPYVRGSGAGTPFTGGNRVASAAAAGAMVLAFAYLIGGWHGLIALGVATSVSLAVAGFLFVRLGGMTGDCYGAIIETAEVAVPAALVAAAGWGLAAA